VSPGSTALLLLRTVHLGAIACWTAGQLWMWRVQRPARAGGEIAVIRRPGAVSLATTLAATLALVSGAGLLAL